MQIYSYTDEETICSSIVCFLCMLYYSVARRCARWANFAIWFSTARALRPIFLFRFVSLGAAYATRPPLAHRRHRRHRRHTNKRLCAIKLIYSVRVHDTWLDGIGSNFLIYPQTPRTRARARLVLTLFALRALHLQYMSINGMVCAMQF